MCKVCDRPSKFFATAELLSKYKVTYYRCDSCGLIETEQPYWLSEAYSEAITASDIGLVSRNIEFAARTKVLLSIFFRESRKFVDYGGGYGMFVRLMRDWGFDFARYDKYCPNLFARGFDVESTQETPFDLLTAFEVFEHLVNPVDDLGAMLRMAPSVFFSTCLIPKHNPPKPEEWWYYVRQSGQHVTLYTLESLRVLAERNNLHLLSAGDLHLFHDRQISKELFRLVSHSKVNRLASTFLPNRRSLLGDDYHKVSGQYLN